MKRVLFDYISLQGFINGGAYSIENILFELKKKNTVEIIPLYDSRLPFLTKSLVEDVKNNMGVDVNCGLTIAQIITEYNIDTFFIGIFQRYLSLNLNNVRCKTILVVHDLAELEWNSNNVYKLLDNRCEPFKRKIVKNLKSMFNLGNFQYNRNFKLYKAKSELLINANTYIVTVSNYSKFTLKYNFPFLKGKEILVIYPSSRISHGFEPLEFIKELKDSGKRYFLLLNANRSEKNALFAIDVLERFIQEIPEYRIVTTGLRKKYSKNHLPLPFISSEQLEYVIKEADALIYPSYFEGFGLPPIEAMKYGTPIICSSLTSIPEVVGGSAFLFSPLFKADLYKALYEFSHANKDELRFDVFERYRVIKEKQKTDLFKIVKLIES